MAESRRGVDLERFLDAQAGVYDVALAELRRGRKASHWMWFVFPQLAGLGRSATAQHFALSSLEEAAAYLEHRVLGSRLLECTAAVNAVSGRSALEIFGSPDDLKFGSSMTLFYLASPSTRAFRDALDRYSAGVPDVRTTALLGLPDDLTG